MADNATLRANRYNSTTHKPPPHTQKHPNGYLVPLLKKLLTKKINIEDPETKKLVKAQVKDAVIWRLILNATQGETPAIKEIIDRIDGKVKDKTEHSVDDDLKGLLTKALNRLAQGNG